MKKLAFGGFVILLLAISVFFLGMNWSVSLVKDQPVYARDDVAMGSNKVIEVIHSGKVLGVDECFFDKSDAYLRVKIPGAGYGFIFDNAQRFSSHWSFGNLVSALKDRRYGYSYDCQRLSGQFGVK